MAAKSFLLLASLVFLASPGIALAEEEPQESTTASPTLLVLHKADDTLGFINPKSLEVEAVIEVGHGPHEVVTTRDGKLAYVANYGTTPPGGNTLSVIDVRRRKRVSTIGLGEFHRPHGLALTRDGARLFVTVESNRAVIEIDTAQERIAKTYATEQQISHMCVLSPDEKTLYVSNLGSESVSVIDLAKRTGSLIKVGEGPEGLDVSPDGSDLWVANRGEGNIMVIDAKTNAVRATMGAGEFPIRLHFSPSGNHALISNYGDHTVELYDVRNMESVGVIEAPGQPIGIQFEPDGEHVWVARSEADTVSRINIKKLEIVGQVATGKTPDGLAWAEPQESAPGGDE